MYEQAIKEQTLPQEIKSLCQTLSATVLKFLFQKNPKKTINLNRLYLYEDILFFVHIIKRYDVKQNTVDSVTPDGFAVGVDTCSKPDQPC